MIQQEGSKTTGKDRYTFLRALDRWVGSLLLFGLGRCRRKRKIPDRIERILILKIDGLGDLILLSAAVYDLRDAFPQARIILMCGPFNYPLASLMACFDEVVVFRPPNPWATLRALRALKPDICLDFGNWPRIEALIAFFSGARWTAGFNTPGQHRHYAHDHVMPLRFDQHEVDNYKSLLSTMGVAPLHPPTLELNAKALRAIQMHRVNVVSPFAVCHLWSGSAKWGALKEWSLDRWCEVVRRLNTRGLAVCFTGGQNERERTEAFIASCTWPDKRLDNLAGLNFAAMLDLLRRAAIVISIDTSIPHLAAALGVSVLSLHGPSHSRRWGAVGPKAEAIDTTCPGCGYMNWGADSDRERAARPCMETISFAEVAERIDLILDNVLNKR